MIEFLVFYQGFIFSVYYIYTKQYRKFRQSSINILINCLLNRQINDRNLYQVLITIIKIYFNFDIIQY